MTYDSDIHPISAPKDPGQAERFPPAVHEPFRAGRPNGRLIADVGAMLSLLKQDLLDMPVLDFGAGTGWISEFCARMGLDVIAIDIQPELGTCLELRSEADRRVDRSRIRYAIADGHRMPVPDGSVGHVLCFDSLYHMRDYPMAFAEFHRVLVPGGRCIFVEPGARHSSSPETIAFVAAQKAHDPDWIERDVVVEEIDSVARAAGFAEGIRVVPFPLMVANAIEAHSVDEWRRFREGDPDLRTAHCDALGAINHGDRVVFLADQGA